MYPNQPSPQGQWANPNAPPTTQAGNWSQQPPNGQYAQQQRQGQNGNQNQNQNQQHIPPITQPVAQGSPMQTLQPQHPDHYRNLPPPQQLYAPPYQPHQQMQYPPTQQAPRQRTAIACRYCRRRKIRCSGFDQSEDGRCTNCQRFSQECVFTPVSSQAQAFVPAHTVWRGQGPPPQQLYGAYGQPLPQHGNRDPYPPQQSPGQYPPPPQGYPQQPPMYQQQPQPGSAGQKRSSDEPQTPTLPPPNPGAQAQLRDGQYSYPDPTGMTAPGASPASSTVSFNSTHLHAQPYYAQPTPYVHRASPQSAYSYDASRASSSPRTYGKPNSPAPPTNGLHLSMPNRTPTPGSMLANAQRQSVNVNELVGPGGQSPQQQASHTNVKQLDERTWTDSKHGAPPTDPAMAAHGGLAKNEELTPKRNGVVDAGVQTELSGPPTKEQAS